MLTSPKTSPILSSMDTPTTYASSDSPLSSPVSSSTQPPSDGMRGVPPSSPGSSLTSSLTSSFKPLDHSSWISEVLYLACPDGRSYMAIFKHTTPGDIPEAMLYGPDVPSWLSGLLQAGVTKDGKHSVGRAYNKHVKGRYQYTSVKGRKEVAELRRLFVLQSK